jgi:hypothetical protein
MVFDRFRVARWAGLACLLAGCAVSHSTKQPAPADPNSKAYCKWETYHRIETKDGIDADEAALLTDWYYRSHFGLCFTQGAAQNSGAEWRFRICGGYHGCDDPMTLEPRPHEASDDIGINKKTGAVTYLFGKTVAIPLTTVLKDHSDWCDTWPGD